MRSKLRALAVVALLFTGTALQAAPAEASVMRPPGSGESCTYSVSGDGMTGTGICKNIGDHTIEVKFTIVCGWSPDLVSAWLAIAPGESDGGRGTCDGGTGVGSIVADIRDL
ncbi:hypothetical protein [Streptomyces vilmorinianum]|uniref:hypothetical protein n=1 Tax=Streptomyces vilmorinianum TaxID=3051092 RepID=UPI0010FB0BBA|nr:hypothetical protein [Streptomyces vilmorinianum]